MARWPTRGMGHTVAGYPIENETDETLEAFHAGIHPQQLVTLRQLELIRGFVVRCKLKPETQRADIGLLEQWVERIAADGPLLVD